MVSTLHSCICPMAAGIDTKKEFRWGDDDDEGVRGNA